MRKFGLAFKTVPKVDATGIEPVTTTMFLVFFLGVS